MSEPGPGGARRALLLAAWTFAFAFVGTAIGGALVLVGSLPDLAPVALAAGALGAVLGEGALRLERRRATGRPAVLDARGAPVRPLATWLLAVPLLVGLLGLLLLVVIGAVYTGSAAVGLAFLGIAVVVALLARPLWVGRALALALEEDAAGAAGAARARWTRLHGAWWATRSGRDQAALNLGLDALRRGDLDAAAGWYAGPQHGRVAAHARMGLALVRVGQDRFDEAEGLIRQAVQGGRGLQRELDGVRVLLVLRRDGPGAALALGERLGLAGAGLLFRGALAEARRLTGDEAGAAELLAGGVREALDAAGLDPLLAGARSGAGRRGPM